jgi:hypothetical protein
MLEFIKPFIYGFIVGVLLVPGWAIAKRIVEEFKLAKEQWYGKSN